MTTLWAHWKWELKPAVLVLHTLEMWPRIKSPCGAQHWSHSPFSSISLQCKCTVGAVRSGIWNQPGKDKENKSCFLTWTLGPRPPPLPVSLYGLPASLIRFTSPILCACSPSPTDDIVADYIMTLEAWEYSCLLIYPALSTPFIPLGYSQASNSHNTLS